MAKTKKATSKQAKSATKKTVKPIEAPRIKLPEDDLPPPAQPTITGMLSTKIGSFFSYLGRHRFKVVLGLLVIAIAGWALNNYMDTRNQLNQLADPKTSTQTEITIITDQVKDTVELPNDETPTIATVSDAGKLKGQNFFKNAENGDKVLIYSKAGKALLYRYTTKKVIEFSNVNLGNNATNNDNQNQNQSQPANTNQQQNPTQNQQNQSQQTPTPTSQPQTR